VSLTSISPLEIDNFSSDVSTTVSYVSKEKKSITLVCRFGETFDLRTVIARFIYIFDSARRRNLPSRSGYIEFDISPIGFRRIHADFKSDSVVSTVTNETSYNCRDEGATGTQEPPFFGLHANISISSCSLGNAPTARVIASVVFIPSYVGKRIEWNREF